MRLLLPAFAASLLLFSACNKNKDFVDATIIDTGDVTLDGCGYLLRLDNGREEKPQYLDSDFQHNDMKVKVKFHASGNLDTCGFSAPRSFFELVIIDEIKRAN